ncbi:MAG: N-acetylmuramoyl-L-alanine amidase, partial [Campylobacter sp.]|nr:N-acetylmuramoyl-L-alanine amidase [Campylobacter sp.]
MIVIDPGHGGKDPGALGNGLKEKTIVLNTAKKLGELL